ncbi:MAG: lipopolysaccharide heptosyltransferase [Rhizobacter sp.]|nr:lipopolysaccharide heptosyltransferase [Rhizobacter sp.]
MRVLIVKLSSLGDVVHAMPVVHDILVAHPGAQIDWVVEAAFAPLLRRVDGIGHIIESDLRRWRKRWWTAEVREQWRSFRAQLRAHRYDAVIDLQGLVKSAFIARLAKGPSYGLANRTEGAGYEWPSRFFIDHPVRVEARIHVVDRSREVAAAALGYAVVGKPVFGLRARVASLDVAPSRGSHPTQASNASGMSATRNGSSMSTAASSVMSGDPARPSSSRRSVVFVHGTSRDDKLWPQDHWLALGRMLIAERWTIELPQGGAAELERARHLARLLGPSAHVWPKMSLDAVVDAMGAAQGAIGVDSGLSHVAVALGLPHVQIYNLPTAWRTGPLAAHGHRQQRSIEGRPFPTVAAVQAAWEQVSASADGD